MDQAKFQEAQQVYEAGDYRAAAKLFLASTGRGAEGNGGAYHMAGNSLMRLRRHADAVAVYNHAVRDETYSRRGAVYANLGTAHACLGELSDAIEAYEAALAEPGYETGYKAWQGIAAAQMERGKAEAAAVAYRKAALDERNPSPGKSLVNLGLCLMALGRYQDAVDAYQAALGFDNYDGRGRALANLGQALVALERYDEAARAFEKSTQLHQHKLSPSAQADYDKALENSVDAPEIIEGWVTGEMPQVDLVFGDHEDEQAPEQPVSSDEEPEPDPVDVAPATEMDADVAAARLGFGDEDAVSSFFTMSEEEMKEKAKAHRRSERSAAGPTWVRSAVIGGVVLAVVLGLFVGGYLAGWGWPTQRSTVNGMMQAYAEGSAVEEYWVAVPNSDVKREMAKIPPVKSFTIEEIDSGRTESTAAVTVTPQEGAVMHYIIILTREGVGWRVTGLDYDWRSTGS